VRAYLEWRQRSGAAPVDIVVLDLTLGDGTTVTENVTSIVADGSPVLIHSVADRPGAARRWRPGRRCHQQGLAHRRRHRRHPHGGPRRALDNVEWASAVDGDRAFRRRAAVQP
jgi:hypothetical protein